MVWVEELDSKLQSYMTEDTYNYFAKQNWLEVVPLTTRSLPQYARLRNSLEGLGWHSALICNGAILLREGREDAAWTAESLELSRAERPEAERLLRFVRARFPAESISDHSPFMFYIKSDNVEKDRELLMEEADLSRVFILCDSRKIYCIPNSLNKGSALLRYKKRFGKGLCFAAGDSAFDIPMLEAADVCLCPASMELFSGRGRRISCGGLFSEAICAELERTRNEVSSLDQ